MKKTSLSLFHPLIQKWFCKNVGQPTDIQEKAWPKIAAKSHVLISAPTGTGKTLAAFLWAINQLITKDCSANNLQVLYISPLKALNNDVQKNLKKPLSELKEIFACHKEYLPDIRILTRSGDTPSDERRKMITNPPSILITTPETLNNLLISPRNQLIFSNLKTVILDEIHSVVANKRGTHLITAIDRLVPIAGEFQRIALSATVKPKKVISEFVAGFQKFGKDSNTNYLKRKIDTIESKISKKYDIKINFPLDSHSKQKGDDLWLALIPDFGKTISKNPATLFFANSRRLTEKIARLINEKYPNNLVYSHHGSLSKEIRLIVEQKLKNRELKAIVATNSLELGIDIGHLDQVILIQTPPSISSAIQRIGRAGHGVNQASKSIIYPTFGHDFIAAAVTTKAIINKEIEPIKPINSPLDVLAQVILAMTNVEKWDINDLYDFLKTSWPYRNLSKHHYNLVLEMLAGKYADSRLQELKPRVYLDRLDNTVKAVANSAFLLYTSGGTIPNRGYFNLKVQDSNSKIGELDEEFVWERKIGETFALGTQLWKIKKITHNDVEVIPTNNPLNIIPFWKAEDRDRDFYFSEKIAAFLEIADEKLEKKSFQKELTNDYFMENSAAKALVTFLKEQKEKTKTSLPHRHHLLLEHFDDPLNTSARKQVIVHTIWGGAVNRPFTLALAAAWEKKYKYPLQTFVSNNAIMLLLPHEFSCRKILDLVTPDNIENLLRITLEKHAFFGAMFRENAERSLLLPKGNPKKRMPLWLNRVRSKKLLKAVSKYSDFPILLETWRSCLQDSFDIHNLKILLEEIQLGKISITETVTSEASPFSSDLIWRETNELMYADDKPINQAQSELKNNFIQELLTSSQLQPNIPSKIVNILESKLQRTAPGYAPKSKEDLLLWIKDRLLISKENWSSLSKAIDRDCKSNEAISFLSNNREKIIWLSWKGSNTNFLCAIENIKKISKAINLTKEIVDIKYICKESKPKIDLTKLFTEKVSTKNKEDLISFLKQWLSYYATIEKTTIQEMLGIPEVLLDDLLAELAHNQEIVVDAFLKNSKTQKIATTRNLEILLRLARKARQPTFKALDLAKLPLFLATFQGVSFKDNKDSLPQVLEQLFGFPSIVSSWEEYILPNRLYPYYSEWLDSLMQGSNLIWLGCGKKKITFTFKEDLPLFKNHNDENKIIKKLFPHGNAHYNITDIAQLSGLSTDTIAQELWSLAWQGKATNNTFQALRNAILSDFKPIKKKGNNSYHHRPRWQNNRWKKASKFIGTWQQINVESNINNNQLIITEDLIRERIRQLFLRYGILFREVLANELPLLQWKAIFRQLRLMELSGEIFSGYFFKDIPGLQFISHEAYRFLNKSFQKQKDRVFWLNATDPASLCGTRLSFFKQKLPARIASNWLVYHNDTCVMTLRQNGKKIYIDVAPDTKNIAKYFEIFNFLLTRSFNPFAKVTVEKINNKEATNSEYLKAFQAFGFEKTYKNSLELRIS